MAVGVKEAGFAPLVEHIRWLLLKCKAQILQLSHGFVQLGALKEELTTWKCRSFTRDLDRERGVPIRKGEAGVARWRIDDLNKSERAVKRLRAFEVGNDKCDVVELHLSLLFRKDDSVIESRRHATGGVDRLRH